MAMFALARLVWQIDSCNCSATLIPVCGHPVVMTSNSCGDKPSRFVAPLDVVFLALFFQHLSEHEDSEYVGNSPIVAQSCVSGSSELAIDVGLGGYLGGAVRSQQA